MRKFIVILLCIELVSCIAQDYRKFVVEESNGRIYLKEMKLKSSYNPSMSNFICDKCIYLNDYKSNVIDFKTTTVIRFFKSGQYIFTSEEYGMINYENLNTLKKGWIGYYNIKDSIITLEYPNLLFRRAGKRNLDKYKILPNGDIKSITKQASDYNAIYQKIKSNSLKKVVPDW